MKKIKEKTIAVLLFAVLALSFMGSFSAIADPGDATEIVLEPRPGDGTATIGFEIGVNQVHLTLTQGTTKGDAKAKIRVYIEPMILGDLQTISWDVKVLEGYRPHIDIYLDLTGDLVRETCLTAEFAHVNGDDPITTPLDTWLSTFEGGSGAYPAWSGIAGSVSDLTTINGETAVWDGRYGPITLAHTLSDYQTPTMIDGINEDARIIYLDIEIDDWTIAFNAWDSYVRNIRLNDVEVLYLLMIGPAGADGADGADGATGATGPQGETGDQGIQGLTGATGDTGDQGPQGIQGVQGIQGDEGPQGIQGVEGPQGETGLTGVQGDKGDTGATGPKGPEGDRGSRGYTGSTGPQGIQGETGEQGPPGNVTGLVGPQGEQGIQGEAGEAGEAGAEGPIGPEGLGLQGETGEQGPKGDTGEQGSKGTTGPQGDPGPATVAYVGAAAGVVSLLGLIALYMRMKP